MSRDLNHHRNRYARPGFPALLRVTHRTSAGQAVLLPTLPGPCLTSYPAGLSRRSHRGVNRWLPMTRAHSSGTRRGVVPAAPHPPARGPHGALSQGGVCSRDDLLQNNSHTTRAVRAEVGLAECISAFESDAPQPKALAERASSSNPAKTQASATTCRSRS